MPFQYEIEIEFNDELCSAIITVEVDHYDKIQGSYEWWANSDLDFYGYTDLEFSIKSIEIEKENGSTFYTNSNGLINELVSDSLYAGIYDWLLEKMEK